MFARAFVLSLMLPLTCPAAVIYSSCPVQISGSDQAIQPELKNQSVAAKYTPLRSYSQTAEHTLYVIAWLTSTGRELIYNPKDYAGQARRTGRWLEDMELAMELNVAEKDCMGPEAAKTDNVAIFPFVRKGPGPASRENMRVRYKVCSYYVDEKRQLPFEDGCTVIGREDGYTFQELEQRAQEFRTGLQKTRENLDIGLYAGSAVAGFTVLKGLRLLRMGRLTAVIGGLVPPLSVGSAIQLGARDELLQGLVDMEGSIEVAITGDLSTSIKVSKPMQTFVPFFERYLNSIPGTP